MEATANLEHKLTFEASLDAALPDLRSQVGRTVRLPEEHLSITYHDTTDSRLWRQGLTLRNGMASDDGNSGKWTLRTTLVDNTPGVALQEFSWHGSNHEPPVGLRKVIGGVLRHEALRPLVTLETRRQRLELRDERDRLLAELDDDVVLVVGGNRGGTKFRQVELKLRDDSWEPSEVIRHLESAGVRRDSDPKFAKATGLPGVSFARPELDKRASLAAVVRASVRGGFSRLVDHDWRLRIALPDPLAHDVHQARVATRRLRSDLKTFRSVLDPVWTQHVRKDLKWVGTALGEIRDVDVLVRDLDGAPMAVERRLAAQRAAAARQLADVLESTRYLKLLDKLHAGSEQLRLAQGTGQNVLRPGRDLVPVLVRARWRALCRQVDRAGSDPSAKQLHKVRIKAKQLRYAAEAARPVVGKPAKRTAAAAKRVQSVLGEHHDAVARESWLYNLVEGQASLDKATDSGLLTLELGRLVADARRHQCEARHRWTKSWKRLAKTNRRRWLRG